MEKPKDYKLLKAETNQKIQTPVVPTPVEPKEPKTEKKPGKETEEPTARQKRDFMAWLKSFFVHAPEQDGAALKW